MVPITDVSGFLAALPTGRIAGFDIGEKTIGVAASDPDRTIATPLETLKRTKWRADAAALQRLLESREPVGTVIGLPLHMNGDDSPRAQAARAFAKNWIAVGGGPVLLWDERLSTSAVERAMIAADMSRKRRSEVVDKAAAAWILQGALDAMRARAIVPKRAAEPLLRTML